MARLHVSTVHATAGGASCPIQNLGVQLGVLTSAELHNYDIEQPMQYSVYIAQSMQYSVYIAQPMQYSVYIAQPMQYSVYIAQSSTVLTCMLLHSPVQGSPAKLHNYRTCVASE